MNDLRLVGKIKEAHGLHGELYVLIFSGETEWSNKLKSIHLSFDEGKSFEELEVKKAKPHKKGFILKTPQITNRTDAEAKKGSLVYIPNELLQSKPGEQIYLAEIEGFEVIDESLGVLGVIESFGSNGPQDLIGIHKSGELIAEVPLVEAFIDRIDFESQKLFMKLPEGLIGEEES